MYNESIFDHFPISATLSFPTITLSSPINTINDNLVSETVRWSDFGSDTAFQYNAIALAILEDVILCTDTKCSTDHSNDIDNFYGLLVVTFTEGTRDFRVKNTKNFVPLPGWNQYCKLLYAEAREAFLEWLRGGKIRYGDEYENMKVKRKEFVNALKYCKENETKIRNDKMASVFRGKNVK